MPNRRRMWISNAQSKRNRQGPKALSDPPTAAPPPEPPAVINPNKWVLADDGKTHVLEMRDRGLQAEIQQKETGAYHAALWQGKPSEHPSLYRVILYIHHADSRDQAIEKLVEQFERWANDRAENMLYAYMKED